MLMQLVLASRNFMFYFGTEKALSDVDFLNSIQFHYPPEDSVRLVDLWDSNRKLTIFSFIQTAFSLSNAICHYEEENLKLSFSRESLETVSEFNEAYTNPPQTVEFSASSRIPSSLFLAVHNQCIYQCCKKKLEEYGKEYLSPSLRDIPSDFLKYYEKIIDAYIDNNLKVFENLLDSLYCYSCYGYSDLAIQRLSKPIRKKYGSRRFCSLGRKELFRMTASLGLVRAFRHLILKDTKCFQDNLEDISKYAIDGGNLDIIHVCADAGSRFSYTLPLDDFPSCFEIACKNSTINILRWLIEEFPNTSRDYSYARYCLLSKFHSGPITTSKTQFLFNVFQSPLAPRISFFESYYSSAVDLNIVPIMKYLTEVREIPATYTLAYMFTRPYFKPNVSAVKYLIEQGADPNIKMGGVSLLQLALDNNNLEFAQFLRDETDRRLQLAKVKEEI
jgi:hypothetical protein